MRNHNNNAEMAEVRADRHRDTKALIEVGVAGFVMAGETQSGDLHLARVRGASATIAAIDGGGHGQEAARAARIAIATIDSRIEEHTRRSDGPRNLRR